MIKRKSFNRAWLLLVAVMLALFGLGGLTSCLESVPESPPVEGKGQAQGLGIRPHVPYLAHLYTEITTDTWYVLIDLSDNSNYPHAATNNIVLKALHCTGDMDSAQHWHWNVGVVTEIGTTNATVEWITGGARTKATQWDERWIMPEHGLNLVVTGATLPFVATTISETNEITSGMSLTSSVGTGVPAVGDLVLYLDETGDEVTFHFTIDAAYDVE